MSDWTMPDWMEPYIDQMIHASDQEELERLYNDKTSVEVNAPLALISCAVAAQVGLLYRLHTHGLLPIGFARTRPIGDNDVDTPASRG